MRNVATITLVIRQTYPEPQNIELVMSEKLWTAPRREVLAIQCGEAVHEDDFSLVTQLFDDVVQHAVASTIGVVARLNI